MRLLKIYHRQETKNEVRKESTVSLYMQLMHVIKEQIHNGTYLEGEQIPTEGELSKMYNISRITIRRAIEELCQQGYLK